MRENYRAWEIDFDEFYLQASNADRLQFLVRFAVLAPSSHNSQPWRFDIADKTIHMRADRRRALPVSDANDRQLFISLGCAAENLIIAADYYGYETSVEYRREGVNVLFHSLQEKAPRDGQHLIFFIPRRHTNRSPYENRPLSADLTTQWMRYETPDLRISFVAHALEKNEIADIVSDALIMAMDDKSFRMELFHYLKPTLTRSPVGMPGSGFGIPLPASVIAPFVIQYLNVNKLSRKKDEALLKRNTPLFFIISTKDDLPEAWMKAGRVYERIALEAEREGVAVHPLAAAIQIADYHKTLQNILRIPFRPQVFSRVGYPSKSAIATPRISATNVIR